MLEGKTVDNRNLWCLAIIPKYQVLPLSFIVVDEIVDTYLIYSERRALINLVIFEVLFLESFSKIKCSYLNFAC